MVDMFFINSHAELGEMMQVAFFVLAGFSVWAQGSIAEDGPKFVDPQSFYASVIHKSSHGSSF